MTELECNKAVVRAFAEAINARDWDRLGTGSLARRKDRWGPIRRRARS
jgi:hypothetical protein